MRPDHHRMEAFSSANLFGDAAASLESHSNPLSAALINSVRPAMNVSKESKA